jgi:Family of unknown function (DUF6266)
LKYRKRRTRGKNRTTHPALRWSITDVGQPPVIFTGVHPELIMDYTMVLLGRGDLPNAASPAVASPSAGKLEFTWTDNSGQGKALATDKAFAAAYCEEMNGWKYGLDLALRSAGGCTLDLTRFKGKAVQTYLGFISANGKDVADTVFTGLVNV